MDMQTRHQAASQWVMVVDVVHDARLLGEPARFAVDGPNGILIRPSHHPLKLSGAPLGLGQRPHRLEPKLPFALCVSLIRGNLAGMLKHPFFIRALRFGMKVTSHLLPSGEAWV